MFIFGWLTIDMELQRSLLRTLCCFQFPWDSSIYSTHFQGCNEPLKPCLQVNHWASSLSIGFGTPLECDHLSDHWSTTGSLISQLFEPAKNFKIQRSFFLRWHSRLIYGWKGNFRKIKWVRQVLHPQRIAVKTIGGFHSSIHWKWHSQDT